MLEETYRVVFMGSPDFAVPALRAVHRHHNLLAVVTQPDKPKGRGRKLAPPPVKVVAEELGVPVLQPETLRRRSVREELLALQPDLFVVVAYGKILRPKMLAVPPLGCVNVHASLLPRLRGAAPIHWAVLRGEKQSGVTIMKMDAGMDTGPMLLKEAVELRPDETAGSLHDRLAPLGAELLVRALDGMIRSTVHEIPQPAEGATLAPMLKKEDGALDFTLPADEVDRRIRGLDPWPGAYCTAGGKLLKLFASSVEPGSAAAPGTVLGADRRGLLLACGEGAVRVRELQLAGRKRMEAASLLAGNPLPAGTVLGPG